MSLFRSRGPGPATPADRPVTRLTVRLPEATLEARVVAVHAGYGEKVERGATVMTLRVGEVRQVLAAPRSGRLLPLAGPGDELFAGDALFALHLDEATIGAVAGELSQDAPAAPATAAPRGRNHAVPARSRPGQPPAQARETARPRPERRGGETPGLDTADLRERVAPPGRERRPTAAVAERRRGGLAGIVRIALALALFAAGVVLLLPLLVELGFGTSDEARLAVTLAALALGLLTWRALAWRAGRGARFGVGLLGAGWAALVILALIGVNPLPLGPVALMDTHALAPANRTRVPPARPTAVPPAAFPGIRAESAAGAPPPELVEPERRVRFSALPTAVFALTPAPAAPPAVAAERSLARSRPPAPEAAPAEPAAQETGMAAGAEPPRPAPPAEPPARFGRDTAGMIAAAPPHPALARVDAVAGPADPPPTKAPPAGGASSGPPAWSEPAAAAPAELSAPHAGDLRPPRPAVPVRGPVTRAVHVPAASENVELSRAPEVPAAPRSRTPPQQAAPASPAGPPDPALRPRRRSPEPGSPPG